MLKTVVIMLVISFLTLYGSSNKFTISQPARISLQQSAPTPTVDRLALPVLPENPTQVELGSRVYYYHCMPCHGDQGQGLTDEWRSVWEEDHQNCWAKGCHSIRDQDEVFTIPTMIPPVSGNTQMLKRFEKAEDLFEFLRKTHPPQTPGILKDEEYWAVTAYLLAKNNVINVMDEVGPLAEYHTERRNLIIAGIVLACIITVLLVLLIFKKKRRKMLVQKTG